MLFKIAMRNIRRSVRDYTIYFVTLLISVMVFYAFNSISDQQVILQLTEYKETGIVEFLPVMMGLFSFVVALVLGFLIIYSNQLLIRRRKHEFGMYFTLGMTSGQVSRVILYETVLVGIMSLIIGLILGIGLSQVLSLASSAFFEVPLPDYQFEFSLYAFILTLCCFVVLYVIVALFNVISIRRCKLIDLLKADAQNQKIFVRNPWVCLVLFVVSIGLLAVAYWQLYLNGMVFVSDDHFVLATALMLIGSLLFFFSLSGFIIAVITHAKKFYLRRLRPFTTRQIASKINTSFVSIWVICILLFFAITTFSTGMSLVDMMSQEMDRVSPYDVSLIQDLESTTDEQSTIDQIENWDDLVKSSAQIDLYKDQTQTYRDLINNVSFDNADSLGSIGSLPLMVTSISQFNNVLALLGKPPIELASDKYLIANNVSLAEAFSQALVDEGLSLILNGTKLTPLSEVSTLQLYDSSIQTTTPTFVVPDAVIESLYSGQKPANSLINIMYQPKEGVEEAFLERLEASNLASTNNAFSRQYLVAQQSAFRMVVTYLALYIGLVLLVATAAVLAVQLVSLTIDSLGRYRVLSQIGCERRMLRRSLLVQILIYFLVPLGLAVCHAAWTISIMCQSLFSAFGFDLLPAILMSAAFILVIYGIYLIMTYFASRSILKGCKA